nr:MAG TPA: hypothetical protein [Bacteriophage sp.]
MLAVPPLKIPLCLGGVLLKSRLLAALRGHPRQRKDFPLEAWRASKGNLPSAPIVAHR